MVLGVTARCCGAKCRNWHVLGEDRRADAVSDVALSSVGRKDGSAVESPVAGA